MIERSYHDIESTLLPCPFCGEKRISFNEPTKEYRYGSINCPGCLVTMPGEVRDQDELIGCWNAREPVLTGLQEDLILMSFHNEPTPHPGPVAQKPKVTIKPMQLSGGRTEYFVSIKVGDRDVTPHVFREEFKAAYHVALYDWLLNGSGDEPDVIEFGPDEWPAQTFQMNHGTAAAAAEAIFDYTDNNLSMFEACCEEDPVKARELYNAAKTLRDLLAGTSVTSTQKNSEAS